VTDKRIRAVLDGPPPAGFARWNGPLIAEALGDVDVQYVWRSLRKQKIDLGGRKSWCESKDPEFAAKAADVVGLYMAPPNNAVVLCIDEKPSIQALERAQGYLKLPNGRALTGHSHDYKRHGTTTLFAAFEVATGKVQAAHKRRRRRKEFLDFMEEVVASYPKKRLEVILDNLNTLSSASDIGLEGRVLLPVAIEDWISMASGAENSRETAAESLTSLLLPPDRRPDHRANYAKVIGTKLHTKTRPRPGASDGSA